jgi:hypothetical protein
MSDIPEDVLNTARAILSTIAQKLTDAENPYMAKLEPRSLLKIPVMQLGDHVMSRTLALSVVVLAPARLLQADLKSGRREWVGSRALRPQFRNSDQVEGGTTEHEQPVHLGQSAQFHLLQGPDLLEPSERLLHQPAFA